MIYGCCIKRTEDILALKEAGYDFYEFSGAALAALSEADFQDMCRLSRSIDFPCRGLNSYSAGRPAIIGWDYSPEATVEYARLLCRRGQALGIKSIGVGSPHARIRPEGMSAAQADEHCADFLRLTAGVAAEYGIEVLAEAVHSGACNYMNYTADAVDMVRKLDIQNLGLVLDFYHMAMMSEALDQARQALPYLRHVHFSTAGEKGYRGFPGEPQQEEYLKIFALLRELSYDGSISIEPSDFDKEQAAACVRFLRELSA